MNFAAWRSPRRIVLLLLVAGVAGLVLLRIYPPTQYAWLPPCPIHVTSGLYCPGCGVARALHALVTGDLRGAVDLNLLLVLLLPLLLVWGFLLFVSAIRDNRWQAPSLPRWLLGSLLVFMGVFTVARNLPVSWGRWLAP